MYEMELTVNNMRERNGMLQGQVVKVKEQLKMVMERLEEEEERRERGRVMAEGY